MVVVVVVVVVVDSRSSCPDSVRAASALNFTAHSPAWPSRITASHEHAAVIHGSRRQHLAVPHRTRYRGGVLGCSPLLVGLKQYWFVLFAAPDSLVQPAYVWRFSPFVSRQQGDASSM
jgi:hypothetical protein